MKKHISPILGDLVKYFDNYYIIDEIINIKNQILPNYKISYYIPPKKEQEQIIIEHHNKNVIFILDKKRQQDIKSYLKFRDNYNSTISYINNKKNSDLAFSPSTMELKLSSFKRRESGSCVKLTALEVLFWL